MSLFQNEQEVYDVMGTFFTKSAHDEAIGPIIQKSGLAIQFVCSHPDAVLTIDTKSTANGASFTVYKGETGVTPDIQLIMKADVANKFWLGSLNLLTAFSLRQIVIKGSMGEVMKLLPVIQAAHQKYKAHLMELGRTDLLTA